MEWYALGKFIGVRLRFVNASNTPYTITNCVAAAVAVTGNNGAALSWVPVLFGGSATVEVPAAAAIGTIGNIDLGEVLSDLVLIPAIDRTDVVGGRYLLQTRTYCALASNAETDVGVLSTFNATQPTGQKILSTRAAGNYADGVGLTNGQIPVENQGSYSLCPASVEFVYMDPVRSILSVGDSLQNGQGGTLAFVSPVLRACNIINSQGATQYSAAAFGRSGQTYATTLENLTDILAATKPDIVRLPIFSPNDEGITTLTKAGVAAMWWRFMQALELCRAAGARVYLVGIAPSWNGSAGYTALATDYNARAKAFAAANGYPFLDRLDYWSDGAGKYKAGLGNADNIHPSEAGYELEAPLEAAIIRDVA